MNDFFEIENTQPIFLGLAHPNKAKLAVLQRFDASCAMFYLTRMEADRTLKTRVWLTDSEVASRVSCEVEHIDAQSINGSTLDNSFKGDFDPENKPLIETYTDAHSAYNTIGWSFISGEYENIDLRIDPDSAILAPLNNAQELKKYENTPDLKVKFKGEIDNWNVVCALLGCKLLREGRMVGGVVPPLHYA